jgi:hypothetical protein
MIGSAALLALGHDTGRRIGDYDFIGTWAYAKREMDRYKARGGKIFWRAANKITLRADDLPHEIEIAWPGSTAERFLQACDTASTGKRIPSLDMLYTLKMSHRFLRNSPHFEKTRDDIYFMVTRDGGARIWDQEWYKDRMHETYDYDHPSLKQSKAEFFSGDGINYVYDHDTIHLAMARPYSPPAYKLFAADGEDVKSDQAKFDALPYDDRLRAVVEEAYVLAIERSQVPHPGTPPYQSFRIALEKICTSVTSGWFREFAWRNYDFALAAYDTAYVDRFWMAVHSGLVQPHRQAA